MTRQETAKIMDLLAAAYPRFYAPGTDARGQIRLWAETFVEDDGKAVEAAVRSFIAEDEKGFPPPIGAIKARLRTKASGKNAWMRPYIEQLLAETAHETD